MKKLILIVICSILTAGSISAQNTFPATGNVGIGTTSPTNKLTIVGTGSVENLTNGSDQDLNITLSTAGAADKYTLITPSTSTNLAFGVGNIEKMRLTNTGQLLIGKTNQSNTAYILDVAGTARVNSVVVNATGADFVFEPTYKLFSLSEVEKYIKENHHLPEIASAREMQADGLNVGDNQIKLLQKVEELTIYIIASDKELNEEKSKVSQQQVLLKQQQTLLLQLQKLLKVQQKEIDDLQNKK